mmetsp:Transcript_8083/g.23950  ORF Transcript_8083/g.23950 Transcript_8083/m.23950 type:complete len:422 (+) Transcript_8083:604-1869(+)
MLPDNARRRTMRALVQLIRGFVGVILTENEWSKCNRIPISRALVALDCRAPVEIRTHRVTASARRLDEIRARPRLLCGGNFAHLSHVLFANVGRQKRHEACLADGAVAFLICAFNSLVGQCRKVGLDLGRNTRLAEKFRALVVVALDESADFGDRENVGVANNALRYGTWLGRRICRRVFAVLAKCSIGVVARSNCILQILSNRCIRRLRIAEIAPQLIKVIANVGNLALAFLRPGGRSLELGSEILNLRSEIVLLKAFDLPLEIVLIGHFLCERGVLVVALMLELGNLRRKPVYGFGAWNPGICEIRRDWHGDCVKRLAKRGALGKRCILNGGHDDFVKLALRCAVHGGDGRDGQHGHREGNGHLGNRLAGHLGNGAKDVEFLMRCDALCASEMLINYGILTWHFASQRLSSLPNTPPVP